MTLRDVGLREQKKRNTRAALQEAALRLALERGPENVRVDDIAEAAGVSRRTYNNYFSSREQAIVAAVTAERERRTVEAILDQPEGVSLSEAVISAIVDQYADTGRHARDVLLMVTTSPALRASYADSVAMSEHPLAHALIERTDGMDPLSARVLAASIGAAARVALDDWLTSVPVPLSTRDFVVPAGSLPDRMRAALSPLAPALEAAAGRTSERPGSETEPDVRGSAPSRSSRSRVGGRR
ncbi:TetR/AcrR family transcriptional regulator [Humibacter antri]